MGYIMDLRKYVGHAPLIMTSAGVLFINDKNQVLLQKRADNGYWSYPGGSMELGETFEDCAKREAFEETGLTCLELTYFTHLSGERMHYIYPNKDEIYSAEIIFLCTAYSGELKVQAGEVMEQGFFALDELPKHLLPSCAALLRELKEKL